MRTHACTLLVASAMLAGCGDEDHSQTPQRGSFDAARAFTDLEAQVKLGPRPAGSAANHTNAELIAGKLRDAGIEDVVIQRPWRNVIGTIPGSESDAILLGAHHDTKDIPGFVGANDGASGVAVVLELARALPNRVDGPSVHFALFDAEEARGQRPFELDGTRGSRQYVRYANAAPGSRESVQGTPALREIESMLLFDLVGDCDLQLPREALSDADLYDYIAIQAGAGDSPFGGITGPIGDDHVPFVEAGVAAVNLIDFTYGPGPSPGAYWHTSEDTLDKVCAENLAAVGEPVLEILPVGR